MKIMPVIPTVNNNRPQRKQAFGTILNSESEKFIIEKFGAFGRFKVAIATAGIRSKLKSHPLVKIIPHQDSFNEGSPYLVEATHLKTSVSKSTSVPDNELGTLIETIQDVSTQLVDALDRMGK